MRKASPTAEKTSPTKMRAALGWASRNRKPWASRKSQRQKMGRHLIRALNQDGLDEGSQSTKYTQVALKKGTSLGPSLFTWRRQNKDNTQRLGTQWDLKPYSFPQGCSVYPSPIPLRTKSSDRET